MFSMNTIKKHAKKSHHDHFFHVAFLTRGGALVAVGWNHGYVHAEDMALAQVWPSKRAGLTLWSYRLTKGGKLAMAKPCPECEALIRGSGISRVRYSDSDGVMQTLKL